MEIALIFAKDGSINVVFLENLEKEIELFKNEDNYDCHEIIEIEVPMKIIITIEGGNVSSILTHNSVKDIDVCVNDMDNNTDKFEIPDNFVDVTLKEVEK
jgi:hypothetical protein